MANRKKMKKQTNHRNKIQMKREDEKMNEKKTNKNKLRKELIAVLVIIGFIVLSAIYLIFINQNVESNVLHTTQNLTILINQKNKQERSIEKCLSDIGIYENIVFIYSEDCIYSQKNLPWVITMKDQTKIKMIATSNVTELIQFMNCMNSFELDGTPTYICLRNLKVHSGMFDSESELKAFVDACK